jgi:membrane protein DedA with SNARE-associated domain
MIDLTALTQYGLPLLFLYILGQQAGLPLPAIPVLIAAGGMGSSVGFPIEVTLTAALAAMIADAGWYWIGTVAGRRVLRTLCRISISPDSCVRRTESTFTRWGAPSLLIARFVPAYSYVAPPLAGIAHTPVATFLMWDGLGALLWAGSAVFVGWLFRDAVGGILSTLAGLGRWGVLLLLAALLAYIGYRWWRRASDPRRAQPGAAQQRCDTRRGRRLWLGARPGHPDTSRALRRGGRLLFVPQRSLGRGGGARSHAARHETRPPAARRHRRVAARRISGRHADADRSDAGEARRSRIFRARSHRGALSDSPGETAGRKCLCCI